MSYMSKQTAQATFHKFCKNFAADLYDEHIYMPKGPYLDRVMEQFHRMGFTGAMGSTDVTHLRWGMCPFTLGRSYTGKEGFPTIAYQVTVDHSGRALAVTEGFTGATNDKTIIRYDAAVKMVREDPVYRDRVFKLQMADGTWITRKGCYLLVDNGYHEWVILMAPTKCPGTEDDTAFSSMLESVRKDVECFFGILKGRFRILKLSIPYHKKEDIDNVFFTCCILHNMLHTFDGLEKLEPGMNWGKAAGNHPPWLHKPDFDVSSVGAKGSTARIEKESGHALLKKQLIASFAYRSSIGDIDWLVR